MTIEVPLAGEMVEEAPLALTYEAVFQAEVSSIVRDVMNIVGSRAIALEISQEAFTRLYINWRKVGKYDRPGAWVRRVAIRLAVKKKVKADREAPLETDIVQPSENKEQYADVRAAIQKLSRIEKAAIVLHYFYDYPTAEVAKNLGCRESTARVHLRNAREHLRELLIPEGYGNV